MTNKQAYSSYSYFGVRPFTPKGDLPRACVCACVSVKRAMGCPPNAIVWRHGDKGQKREGDGGKKDMKKEGKIAEV